MSAGGVASEAGAYAFLARRFERMALLGEAAAVLHWDHATCMPRGGADARAAQLAALDVTRHEALTDPAVGAALDAAESDPPAGPSERWERANLREMRRLWRHAVAVPAELVAAWSRARSDCEVRWREARRRGDFAALAPSLAEVVARVREVAAARGEALGVAPYDALLDAHDPGLRDADVTRLFDALRAFLPDLLERVLARQAAGPAPPRLRGPFPAERQRLLAERVMRALGFDFRHGRLDTSDHPFTGGVPDDVRVTTRWDESDFTTGLMAVVHETGHALYERGLPARFRHQPVGRSRGMTAHESQSLFWEMQVARSPAFLRFVAAAAGELLGGPGAAWDPEALRRRVHRVERGLVRVDADEVTYPFHVILRHDLERALVAGTLRVEDLPGAWSEGLARGLGVTPPDDRQGCLQDVHWPSGAFGYFPTYTLGALAAAQLFAAVRRERPGLEEALARGDVAELRAWLGERVHARGCLLETPALLEEATGAPLGVEAFRGHLERRYLEEAG